jgi:hypothetical protein
MAARQGEDDVDPGLLQGARRQRAACTSSIPVLPGPPRGRPLRSIGVSVVAGELGDGIAG